MKVIYRKSYQNMLFLYLCLLNNINVIKQVFSQMDQNHDLGMVSVKIS